MITRIGHVLANLLLVGLLLVPAWTGAQTFTSGSTGGDGPFNPPVNVPPGTTVNGSTYTVPLPSSGIFNFTTITVASGIAVTFTKNAANTPVILLAQGAVTINGTLDVSGSAGGSLGRPGLGGPGGFEGGKGADGVTTTGGGFGLGPGGGSPGRDYAAGGGGGYATNGMQGGVCASCPVVGTPGGGGPAYGNPALRPILGGSGGGGGGAFMIGYPPGGGGGGGGGAILLASSTSIALGASGTDAIRATGGTGGTGMGGGGGGAGGAIRVIAPTISGAGYLKVAGAYGAQYYGGQGGNGWLRIEATTLTYSGTNTPGATTGLPQPVFPGTGQPSLAITSVGGLAAPASPSGSILAAPDILLPAGTTNPVTVVLTAGNIPLGISILVTATPQTGAKSSATSSGLTGTLQSSTATASLTLNLSQASVLTATATFPLVASAGPGPIYADGEEVTHIKVAAVLGSQSSITYITQSGREVVAQ
jgi:hypothetical protein